MEMNSSRDFRPGHDASQSDPEELNDIFDIRKHRDIIGLHINHLSVLIEDDLGPLRESLLFAKQPVRPRDFSVLPKIRQQFGVRNAKLLGPGILAGDAVYTQPGG
jgi:hypothetical protein